MKNWKEIVTNRVREGERGDKESKRKWVREIEKENERGAE